MRASYRSDVLTISKKTQCWLGLCHATSVLNSSIQTCGWMQSQISHVKGVTTPNSQALKALMYDWKSFLLLRYINGGVIRGSSILDLFDNIIDEHAYAMYATDITDAVNGCIKKIESEYEIIATNVCLPTTHMQWRTAGTIKREGRDGRRSANADGVAYIMCFMVADAKGVLRLLYAGTGGEHQWYDPTPEIIYQTIKRIREDSEFRSSVLSGAGIVDERTIRLIDSGELCETNGFVRVGAEPYEDITIHQVQGNDYADILCRYKYLGRAEIDSTPRRPKTLAAGHYCSGCVLRWRCHPGRWPTDVIRYLSDQSGRYAPIPVTSIQHHIRDGERGGWGFSNIFDPPDCVESGAESDHRGGHDEVQSSNARAHEDGQDDSGVQTGGETPS